LRLYVCYQARECADEVPKVQRQAKAFGLEIMKLELINDDCMNVMRDYPDNYFDLAIVDPPYGIEKAFSATSRIAKYGNLETVNDLKPNNLFFKTLFNI
jgi:predicted TIM-barrel fold metal-dependent hydrolase